MLNWQRIKKVHLTGIKGVGMTALACCFKDLKLAVSGSDVKEVFVTDKILEEKQINFKEFSPQNINKEIDLLVFTGAHQGEQNSEVEAARKLKIKTISQGEVLGELMALKKIGVSVCGVGGKTTTTAMVATLLDFLRANPSYAIGGGLVKPLNFPGKFNPKGQVFVAEADEYAASPTNPMPKFLYQKPKIIVLTNLEYDHPDVYHNFKETQVAFLGFINRLPKDGLLLIGADEPRLYGLLDLIKVPFQTFGSSGKADWRIDNEEETPKGIKFSLTYKRLCLEGIELGVPGHFNVLNAVASLAVVNFLGFSLKEAAKNLNKFKGVKRRFEFITQVKGISFYDDYAHHPKQLRATLEAAKRKFPYSRIWAVFQPHTYSRTKALFNEFSRSFKDADFVVLTPIYASAREKKDPGVSSLKLARLIAKSHARVCFKEDPLAVAGLIKAKSQAGDIIFTLGAGDIFKWQTAFINFLKNEA